MQSRNLSPKMMTFFYLRMEHLFIQYFATFLVHLLLIYINKIFSTTSLRFLGMFFFRMMARRSFSRIPLKHMLKIR